VFAIRGYARLAALVLAAIVTGPEISLIGVYDGASDLMGATNNDTFMFDMDAIIHF